MARRKRADYSPPKVRQRERRPGAPVPRQGERRASAFPPGTLRRVLVGGALGALVLSGAAAFVLHGQRETRALQAALTAGDCVTDRRSDPVTGPHRPDPVFRIDPPAGGTHTAEVSRAGVYAGPDVPADGPIVHALEHGYVVLWHRPGTPRDELARIQAAHPGDVLVVERPSLPVPVAATAWERRLLCSKLEPPALERFVTAYVGKGPEDVPRG